jgi:hypothetical protein
MSDKVILDHGGLNDWLTSKGWRALADGGFEARSHILVPYSKQDITHDNYEERIAYNGKFCHVRARVEHAFGGSRLGRFTAFNGWKATPDAFLADSVACAMIVLNIEVMLRYGVSGFVQPLPERPVLSEQMQMERYPKPPAPGAKAKRTRKVKPQTVGGTQVADTQPLITAWMRGSQV